jgi:pSer/pThr/pTyr-binding forkhead associated (FHA) protein
MISEAPGSVLEVVAGPAEGARLDPIDGSLEIGRSASGPGTLGNDSELSRRHARLGRDAEGRLTLEDLGSTNGTFVNGARIESPKVLSPGDEVELGATRLKVKGGAPAQPEPSAAQPEPRAAQPEPRAAPPERRPALRVVAGFAPGALVHVGDGLTLGRSGAGAKALRGDPEVADEHVRVSPTGDGRLLVEDLGSPAGTVVRDARIHAPTLLSKGDRVQVGGTTLEVVEAAGSAREGGVSGVLGGVRQVPEGLFARIGMRAPVTVRDVLTVFVLSLGWAFAANLLVRTLAIEALDVDEDLHSLVLWQLLLATFFPVAGNSFGFYMTFRRPDDKSVTRYLIPTLLLPVFFTALNLITSDAWAAKEVAITVAVTIIPVLISAPLMFRMRARVARERVGAMRGGGQPTPQHG